VCSRCFWPPWVWYGVIAYMVERRTSEIGIRMALGADRGRIVRLVLREASVVLGLGLLIGTAMSLAGSRAAANHAVRAKADRLCDLRSGTRELVTGCGFGEFPARPGARLGSIRWWR